MQASHLPRFLVLPVLAVLALFPAGGCRREPAAVPAAAKAEAGVDWTCSMHPQIRQPKPGRCPLCGMDLIPAGEARPGEAGAVPVLIMSPAARRLAEIEEAPVERRTVHVEIPLLGRIRLDETRVAVIAPRVSGRIDRLYANFTGMAVKAGDPLADLYSPELVSAQQELLQAVKAAGSGGGVLAPLLEVTRERLRLWGLTPAQIREIETAGRVRDHLTFVAPIGGVVVEKEVREGQYVEAGMKLLTVADLSRVWVALEAYEADLPWLRTGQQAAFAAEAYPGQTFTGAVVFIDPLLDPMTRTVGVRVEAPNPGGLLKPGMFVRATVRAPVAADGTGEAPLVIPATAPLLTGTRAVVYVALGEGRYEGREVALGPRAGDFYVVRDGLREGDRVVARGAFKIDSSLQIEGRPSMMAPGAEETDAETAGPGAAGGEAAPVPAPAAFRAALNGAVEAVLKIGTALADDRFEPARAAAAEAKKALAAVDPALLEDAARAKGGERLARLEKALAAVAGAGDLAALRAAFEPFSRELIGAIKAFGPVRPEPLYVVRCPMAFEDKGGVWLQADKAVRNVYFGKEMLTCGEIVETIGPAGEPHRHE